MKGDDVAFLVTAKDPGPIKTVNVERSTYNVHPWPGGGTWESPRFSALVGPPASAQASFVWFTAVNNRQQILPSNNIPSTAKTKDTSWTSFDMRGPTLVTVMLKNKTEVVATATVLPSSYGVAACVSAGNKISLTIDRPRQVCLVVNGNMDSPLCIFADPPEAHAPTQGSPG
jgi:hypothetical protein